MQLSVIWKNKARTCLHTILSTFSPSLLSSFQHTQHTSTVAAHHKHVGVGTERGAHADAAVTAERAQGPEAAVDLRRIKMKVCNRENSLSA